jgi:hypothetical protein
MPHSAAWADVSMTAQVISFSSEALADEALFEVVQLSALAIAHKGLRQDRDFRNSLSAKCKRYAMLQDRCQ